MTSNYSWYFTYITEQNLCQEKGKNEHRQSTIKLKQWKLFQILNLNHSMTVFETRKRSHFICISFVFKRQAKIKAVSTQIMCRGKHSNYLLKDETKPIIPTKGLGLQVTNHKNDPLFIFKKLGSSVCLKSTKGNFHFTCDILGITDSFQ